MKTREEEMLFAIMLVMIISNILVLLMPILGLIFGYFYGIDMFFKITLGGWLLLIVIAGLLDTLK